jgi:hypothetical protein
MSGSTEILMSESERPSGVDPERVLIFDRTPVARLISCAAVFASAALVFNYFAETAGDIELLSMAGLILLFLGTLAAAIVQYGDHIYVSDHGVMYENTVLRLAGRKGRWMRWDDVVEIREIRRKVLVLLARDGRRLLVDSIAPPRTKASWWSALALTREDRAIGGTYLGYAIAKAEILRRAPQAIFSGTLAREDS